MDDKATNSVEGNVFDPIRVCAMIERHRRLIGCFLVLVLFAAAITIASSWGPRHPIRELFEELGVLFIAVGVAGRALCMVYIGGQKNRALFQDGPYAVCRNPLYFCSMLGIAGIGLAGGSITLALVAAMLFGALFSAIVCSEEYRLAQAFGRDYEEYSRRVPRWLPAFRLWRDPPSLSPRGTLIARTVRDSGALLAAVPLFEAIEYGHATGILPLVVAAP